MNIRVEQKEIENRAAVEKSTKVNLDPWVYQQINEALAKLREKKKDVNN